MEITCLQMDVLISFYIDGELSETLKAKVEEHLQECPSCRAKLNIIKSLFVDFKKNDEIQKEKEEDNVYSTNTHASNRYHFFKNNLSAYVDNELPNEECVKMKKYTITNKKARKELEDTYRIRKLMRDSFRKSNSDTKPDFSKSILKQINMEDSKQLMFNPIISVAFGFIICVLIISAIVIYLLSLD